MANLSDEFSELSHDKLQYIINSYFFWACKTMKQRGINIRSWKAWKGARRRVHPTYCKTYPRIMVEEQIEKMRKLIAKARIRQMLFGDNICSYLRISKLLPQIFASGLR